MSLNIKDVREKTLANRKRREEKLYEYWRKVLKASVENSIMSKVKLGENKVAINIWNECRLLHMSPLTDNDFDNIAGLIIRELEGFDVIKGPDSVKLQDREIYISW